MAAPLACEAGVRPLRSPAMNDDQVNDGTLDQAAPATPAALFARLAELGIESETVEHEPVFTVEEAKARRGEMPGAHIKNLFLRNKKGGMWLLTCLEDRRIDLKALGGRLGAGRLSFGSADRLMTYLGVMPGAVTPLAAVNDRQQAVTLVLDQALMAHDPVNCHPLVNTMTTALAAAELIRFLESVGHPPQMIDLDAG